MKVKALKKRTQNIHISLFYCLHSTQTWAYNLKQISVCTPFPCFLRGRQCWKKKTSNILAAHTRTIIPTLSSASFSHVNIYALIWIRSRSTNCSFHPTSNFTSDGINLRVSPPTFRFFFFYRSDRAEPQIVSVWRRTSAGTFHRGAPSPLHRTRSLLCPHSFEFHLHSGLFIMVSRHCSTFMWKTNPDYLKYPTYNFPLSLQYSHWFTLDSYRFRANRGPPLGRLETASSYPLSSSNPGSLETAGPVIAIFFFWGGSPMRTGHQPIRGLFTFCDWQYSGTEPANHNLQNKEGGSFVNIWNNVITKVHPNWLVAGWN